MIRRRRHNVGAAPGSLNPPEDANPTSVWVTCYDTDTFSESELAQGESVRSQRTDGQILWVDIRGLGNVDRIREIASELGIHPLAVSDMVNTPQRGKAHLYNDSLHVVTHAVADAEDATLEQVSLYLGHDFLVTVQERDDPDCFDAVRGRIRRSQGRVRSAGHPYLAFATLDLLTDAYFPILDNEQIALEKLEDAITDNAGSDELDTIHRRRKALNVLRRVLRQHRDAILASMSVDSPLYGPDVGIYMSDCLDHANHIVDSVETLAENTNALRDLHINLLSAKMNEVMKVLTIIATIFIPLSFFAGVYGMNFNTEKSGNLPELDLPYAYLLWWIVMGLMVLGMLYFFWRRGWLGGKRKK